jgi:hypothetical protein
MRLRPYERDFPVGSAHIATKPDYLFTFTAKVPHVQLAAFENMNARIAIRQRRIWSARSLPANKRDAVTCARQSAQSRT